MKTFQIILRDTAGHECIEDVVSFVGEDASGSFGIRAGHDRMITSLVFGLARFRLAQGPWQYLAMPGAMLYFIGNRLHINTRRYLRSEDYENVSQALVDVLAAEEQELLEMKTNLRRIEESIMRRLLELESGGKMHE
jgi:F-type H+-transporting ATPase subunit epsilon